MHLMLRSFSLLSKAMACWSDTETLVNYLRHTFITCDDTGICEAVLEPPARVPKPGGIQIDGGWSSDEEDGLDSSGRLAHSPDIQVDPGHRPRSNTSKQLEELKQQRLTQNKVKIVQWKDPGDQQDIPDEEWKDLFYPRSIEKKSCPLESVVSRMVKDAPFLAENPYRDFARFEATKGESGAKSFSIFLPMLADVDARCDAITVSCVGIARVSELVGLVCYRYTAANLQPPLNGEAYNYSLFMAEDTGEIEADLPPLSSSEIVARVGFPALALVERPESSGKQPKNVVTVYFPSGESYKLDVDSLDITLEAVKDRILEKHFQHKKVSEYTKSIFEYNVEKVMEPGVSLPLDLTVQNAGTAVFVMVRQNSSRGDFAIPGSESPTKTKKHPSISSLQPVCHFYNVQMVHKIKTNTPVQLAVCTDKVEIVTALTERKHTGSARIFKPTPAGFKSVSYSIKQIGGLEILDEKHDRKLLRLLHNSAENPEWRFHYFEADADIAGAIMRNLNKILDQAKTPAREAFNKRSAAVPRKATLFKKVYATPEQLRKK